MQIPHRAAALLVLACAAACGDDPPAGPPTNEALRIEVAGRLERSAVIEIRALRGDRPLPPDSVAWSADPADAVELLADGQARLRRAGAATLTGTAAGASGSRELDIAVPPTIVFHSIVAGNRDIYRAALDGGDLVRLTTHPGDDRDPTVAAGTVVFTSFRDGNAELYSIPLEGGTPRRLTISDANEMDPALSADGERLAFTSSATGVSKLWSSAADGAGARRETAGHGHDGSIEAAPSWAPAGDRLVFLSTAAGGADFYVLDVVADAITPLVIEEAADVEPAWSPDGAAVAFASNRDGPTNLYLLDIATGDVRRLSDRAETDAEPAWLADGRIVYAARVDGAPRLRWLDPTDPGRIHEVPLGSGAPGGPAGTRP